MEYVVYLVACIVCIVMILRVRKALLAKGYKRGVCSVASGLFGFCAFFFVIVCAVSVGLIKPKLPEAAVVNPSTPPTQSSEIPQ